MGGDRKMFTKVPRSERQKNEFFPKLFPPHWLPAGTYYVGRALCSLLHHFNSQMILPPPSPKSLPFFQ